jgi:predicted nucleic acid-binding protein
VALVVDASTLLSWHFQDEDDPHPILMRRLVEEPVFAPAHFAAELANGIVVAERRRRTNPAHTANLMELMELVAAEMDDEGSSHIFDRVLPLARAHRLTIYDALYLELAERRGLTLATRDGPLSQAALRAGVEVICE